MPATPASTDSTAIGPFRLLPSIRGGRRSALLSAALAAGLAIGFTIPAAADPVDPDLLDIGSVATFKGVTAPHGPWTLGDKDFTWLDDSGNWTGKERIYISVNANPSIFSHEFNISQLGSYSSPITLELGYQIHINGADGPDWHFQDVAMSKTWSGATVEAWKDVYGSLHDFQTLTTPGTGTLASLYTLNNTPAGNQTFPFGLTDLWVRDTITLSSGGSISSLNDTFRQTNVPEIDPESFTSVLAMTLGSLSVLGRRVRRSVRRVPAA